MLAQVSQSFILSIETKNESASGDRVRLNLSCKTIVDVAGHLNLYVNKLQISGHMQGEKKLMF